MQKAFTFFNTAIAAIWRSFMLIVPLLLIIGIVSSCQTANDKEKDSGYPLLGAGFGLYSSTFLVDDLRSTRDYFVDTLGFDMSEPDGFEKGTFDGTLTTSIYFPDMSTIGFLALEDSLVTDSTPSYISKFLANYEGVQSYSLSSSSADTTYDWLTAQGFQMDSVQSYRTSDNPPEGWSRDDGGNQERSLDFKQVHLSYLPRFIEDVNTDYQKMHRQRNTYYAFFRSYANHPNGVVGIASLQIAVDDLDEARKAYKKMGLAELIDDTSDNKARFQLKRHQEIELVASQATDDALSKFLQARGSGVFAIRFDVANLDSTYQFLSERLPAAALTLDSLNGRITVLSDYAQGVQLEFVNEPNEQALRAEKFKLGAKLDSVALDNAADMYQKYCALCHGENREGYAADFAPSLRSHSLLATSNTSNFLRYTVQFGRSGTAMAGYLDSQGGPLEYIEIELILQWLYEQSGVEEPIELSREPVLGNVELGAEIYSEKCAVCHGPNGEGISAPALGNAMLLATATDEFLKYAIMEGRDGTPMIGFKDSLSVDEINGLTAFLRSRASGWNIPKGDTVRIPTPEEYVLNPNSEAPNFDLRDGLYVPSKQVYQAMQDSARMIILDARSKVAWRQTHIPGSVPVPYYEEPEAFVEDLPNDGTWIVVYCACPHAASQRVINTLKRYGYENTAIIDEGVLVWAQLGYPVKNGQ
ncbi:MAG: mono/diheme cytochrome c family protein/rhodanese-related sulfurtransferase [Paraglaciecola sp.]|jgi:mono/diheme cytochrome c family protein/rhodanese-related sulfurtransferase/catechol 2,3-dioxygenase-like lactoylglutathione lyase family enzyme